MSFLTFLLPSFLSRQQKTTRPNVNSLSLLRLHGLRGLGGNHCRVPASPGLVLGVSRSWLWVREPGNRGNFTGQ